MNENKELKSAYAYNYGRDAGYADGFVDGYKTGYNNGKSLKGDDIISRKEAIKAIHDEYDEITNIDESGEWIARDIEEIIQRLPNPSMREAEE